MQNRRLVWLKVVENEKFITQNYKILGQEFVHIQNIMGLIKRIKKIVLWFCQLAEKERKFTWEVKQSEIFLFLLRHGNVLRPSFRDKDIFCCTFLGFLQLMYPLPI